MHTWKQIRTIGYCIQDPSTRRYLYKIHHEARRVWEWWRSNNSNPKIHYFAVAAGLVALVQVSNAKVERMFSQVKVI